MNRFNPSWFQNVKDKFGEMEVPILKVVWRPEIKEFQNKKEKAKFATVFSIPLHISKQNEI